MSLSVLQIIEILLLVSAAYGQTTADTGLKHLLSENDGDIESIPFDENLTKSLDIIPSTPVLVNYPYVESTGVLEPLKPQTAEKPPSWESKPPVILSPPCSVTVQPSPIPTASVVIAPICGKKGTCYRWFDEEWELVFNGYKPCTVRDKRRAKYCCIQ